MFDKPCLNSIKIFATALLPTPITKLQQSDFMAIVATTLFRYTGTWNANTRTYSCQYKRRASCRTLHFRWGSHPTHITSNRLWWKKVQSHNMEWWKLASSDQGGLLMWIVQTEQDILCSFLGIDQDTDSILNACQIEPNRPVPSISVQC